MPNPTPMDQAAADRIAKGSDPGFKERAQEAASKHEASGASGGKSGKK